MNNEQTLSNLRILRISKDFSQLNVAEMLGVSQTSYSNYESGKTMPADDMKNKIAGTLGTTWNGIESFHKNNQMNRRIYEVLLKKMEQLETDVSLLKNVVSHQLSNGGG